MVSPQWQVKQILCQVMPNANSHDLEAGVDAEMSNILAIQYTILGFGTLCCNYCRLLP